MYDCDSFSQGHGSGCNTEVSLSDRNLNSLVSGMIRRQEDFLHNWTQIDLLSQLIQLEQDIQLIRLSPLNVTVWSNAEDGWGMPWVLDQGFHDI